MYGAFSLWVCCWQSNCWASECSALQLRPNSFLKWPYHSHSDGNVQKAMMIEDIAVLSVLWRGYLQHPLRHWGQTHLSTEFSLLWSSWFCLEIIFSWVLGASPLLPLLFPFFPQSLYSLSFETVSYVAQAALKLMMIEDNPWTPISCLCLLNAEVIGMHHHTWLSLMIQGNLRHTLCQLGKL